MAYMTTTFLMWAVGGLRPSWLSVCKPSVSITPGYPYQFFTDSICTTEGYAHALSPSLPLPLCLSLTPYAVAAGEPDNNLSPPAMRHVYLRHTDGWCYTLMLNGR